MGQAGALKGSEMVTSVVSTCFLFPLAEEALFRGLIQTRPARR